MNGENPFYGGGGYMSQASPFGSGGGSPGGSSRRGTSHSLRPVMLKQLAEATQEHTDAEWKIGDVEIGQIMIVAHVISVQPQTTNCVYLLHDGTAQYEARQWVDANNDDEEKTSIREGSYARILGSLKAFGQKRYITATHIREIPPKDVSDQLFFHILDAASTTLIFERGPPPRPSEGASITRSGGGGGTTAYMAQSHSSGASHPQFAGLPTLQKHIVNFILAQPPSEEGVHVAAIARHVVSLGAGGDAHAISGALEELMDQGHVYSTMDESHFLVSM